MGQVISAKAAAEDILDDVDTAAQAAAHRGGVWAKEAEEFLSKSLARGRAVLEELATRTEALTDARMGLRDLSHRIRMTTGAFHDELWNRLGRPRHDDVVVVDRLLASSSSHRISAWKSRTAVRRCRSSPPTSRVRGQVAGAEVGDQPQRQVRFVLSSTLGS